MAEWIRSSSILILAVVLLRALFRRHISPVLCYALWGVVLLRLLIPVSLFYTPVNVSSTAQQLEQTPQVQAVTGGLYAPSQSFDSACEEVLQEEELTWDDVSTLPREEYYAFQSKAEDKLIHSAPVYTIERALRILWISGMVIIALWLCALNLRFYRRLRRSRKVLEGTDAPIRVYVSDTVETPCLFGLFRPAVYLTTQTAENAQHLDHVLTHELTHYRHYDHIWSALRCLCLVLHWYNPLVWLAASLSRADAELACDHTTIRKLGEDCRTEYGKTLIEMTCVKVSPKTLMLTATTMLSGKKTLKERIRFVAKKPKLVVIAVIAVLVIAGLAIGFTFSGTKDADIPEEDLIYRSDKVTVVKTEPCNPRKTVMALWDSEFNSNTINGSTPVLSGTIVNIQEVQVDYTYHGEKKVSYLTLLDFQITDVVYAAGQDLAVGDTVTVGVGYSTHEFMIGLPVLRTGKEFLFVFQYAVGQYSPLEEHQYTDLWVYGTSMFMMERFDDYCLVSNAFAPYLLESDAVNASPHSAAKATARTLQAERSPTGNAADQPYNMIAEYQYMRKLLRELTLGTVVNITDNPEYIFSPDPYATFIHNGAPTLQYAWDELDTSALQTSYLYLYNQDTGEISPLVSSEVVCHYPTEEHVYYVTRTEPSRVYRIKYDGTGKSSVCFSDAGAITFLSYSGENAWGKVGMVLDQSTIAIYDISAKNFQILVENADIHNGFVFDGTRPTISYYSKQRTRIYCYNYESNYLSSQPDMECIREMLPSSGWDNCMVAVLFDTPADIDLAAFFHGGITNEISDEEREYLISKGFDPNLSIQKMPVKEMDAILRSVFDIGLADTKGIGLDKMVYYPKYDSYYTNNNDTNLVKWNVYDIQKVDDGYLVYYTADREPGKFVFKILIQSPKSFIVFNKPVE